ncbi:MAG: preprotein translocase subunit YajC [Lactobacillales bacterium]|jgi:preprotein translocase subunit YajC|nr:preprotein translocase subunit YajC [Lactobacillales bacterium]
MGGNAMMLVLGLALVVWLVVTFRQQKKQQQDRLTQLNEMKSGDKIITIGGLHGLLHEQSKEKGTITLDCEGIYLEFEASAIRSIESA